MAKRPKKLSWLDIAASKVGLKNKDRLAAFSSDKPAKRKYNNIETIIDGIKFDSLGEGERYKQLRHFERQGLIKDLRLQVKFELTPKAKLENGSTVRAMFYIADFVYFNNKLGREVVEDFKGRRTQTYINKAKMMLAVHGIEIYETNNKNLKEWKL